MEKIAVLGSGMVGRTIALDLAKSFEVTSVDKNEPTLGILKKKNQNIQTKIFDLSNFTSYPQFLSKFDYVVTAVPGFMGFNTLKAVINAGKNVADISFFPEDALSLNQLAIEKNVTVLTDMGVAPGIPNLFLGRKNEDSKISAFEFFVGGLPKIRKKPFEYKAPFSPIDVIEEYLRPARFKEKGEIVIKPALTDRKFIFFDKIGTLEAFNTDGLRSILQTMPHIPSLKEQTLRYPGHIDLIIALKESGFFNTELQEINGTYISPLKFTSQVLMNEWKLSENEEELTVLKMIFELEINGEIKKEEFDLVDYYDPVTELSSMSRTTGYTCTAGLQLMANKLFTDKGVFPPELVGKNETCFDFIIDYLNERNIKICKSEK